MVSKKNLTTNGITAGVRLLLRVGNLFHSEIIEAVVKEVNPKGDCVRIGNGIEWYTIKSLKIVDILKV